MTICAIVSFRLGLTDGVSIIAENWRRALDEIGFEVMTIAGEGPVDRVVSGLALGATESPAFSEVENALGDADLVVVENLCTIPLNLPAARVVTEVLRGRPAILHHHDPPWQREHFAHITELPPIDPAWRHVTVNELTRTQMADRGISATTIYNGFDTNHVESEGESDRDATRASIGVAPSELLFGHPVRAIERKGIAAAIDLCELLDATYWLLGDAEDGYGPALERIISKAKCRVIHRQLTHGPGIYAAPDVIVFPSTWEGFGNPPIEASLARKPVAVGPYAVGRELRDLGFQWFDVSEPSSLQGWLDDPDDALLDNNRKLACEHFSLELMTAHIRSLLDDAGWLP